MQRITISARCWTSWGYLARCLSEGLVNLGALRTVMIVHYTPVGGLFDDEDDRVMHCKLGFTGPSCGRYESGLKRRYTVVVITKQTIQALKRSRSQGLRDMLHHH